MLEEHCLRLGLVVLKISYVDNTMQDNLLLLEEAEFNDALRSLLQNSKLPAVLLLPAAAAVPPAGIFCVENFTF